MKFKNHAKDKLEDVKEEIEDIEEELDDGSLSEKGRKMIKDIRQKTKNVIKWVLWGFTAKKYIYIKIQENNNKDTLFSKRVIALTWDHSWNSNLRN